MRSSNLINVFFTLCVFLLGHVELSQGMSCKDENNQDVDWFIIYKLPKIDSEQEGSNLAEGSAYAFITSDGPKEWKLSTLSIESQTSILGKTWHDYDNKRKDMDTAFLFYNDDAPDPYTKHTNGHLKGMVALDKQSGFWLIHSIPNFGEMNKYEYPKTGLVYGQSAICITSNTASLNDIANHLLYCNPYVYEYGIADSILQDLDENGKTLFSDKPDFIHKPPFLRKSVLKSQDNMDFHTFAKDNQLQDDLYSEILAPNLSTSLVAETWRRGNGGVLPPSCKTKFTVTDTVSITLVVSNRKEGISFNSIDDHSKWTIALEVVKPWVCIGDLNRVASQAKRGGGAVCFQSDGVWKAYNSIITETDKCPA